MRSHILLVFLWFLFLGNYLGAMTECPSWYWYAFLTNDGTKRTVLLRSKVDEIIPSFSMQSDTTGLKTILCSYINEDGLDLIQNILLFLTSKNAKTIYLGAIKAQLSQLDYATLSAVQDQCDVWNIVLDEHLFAKNSIECKDYLNNKDTGEQSTTLSLKKMLFTDSNATKEIVAMPVLARLRFMGMINKASPLCSLSDITTLIISLEESGWHLDRIKTILTQCNDTAFCSIM